MKNVINRILSFSLVSLFAFMIFDSVKAIEIDKDNKSLKIYDIKEKEEVLVENNKIIDFYEESHEQFEIILEEKRKEEERIEKEKRVSYKEQIVGFAKQFVGNPYVMGGNSLTNGTDCSGFVMLVYGNFGVSLPRSAYDQQFFGNAVSIDDIEIGDIISYGYNGYVSHSALYIGDGMIVHAATQEQGIIISSLYIMPIVTIRRVI